MHLRPARFACFAVSSILVLLSGCASLPATTLIDRHVPQDYSGVVAVRMDARSTLATRATGLASREDARPNTAQTRYLIGSATKWISSIAVLRLVDMGKLELDAPVARYLPELPPANGAVTLRQLLSNRSGIPNGLEAALRTDPSIRQLNIGPVAAALRFGAGALSATPGETWDYSVVNWVIVAAVVERANNKPFTETVAELVFAPANVHDTGFAAAGYDMAPNMAVAYNQAGARKMSPVPPMVAASGTVYSTARDLIAIADTVYFTGLLSERSRTALATIQVGSEDYALGGRVRTVETGKGTRILAWESGTFGGYKTLLAYDPRDGAAVVLLNNTDMQQSGQTRIALALFNAATP